MEPDVDPRELPRDAFDPLICAQECRRGREIPHSRIEQQVALALARSGGKLTPLALKPIRSHFDQYMPLPTKASDPVFKRLEAAPADPRNVTPELELALVEHLYRTIKQDFAVSLIMRFANPRDFCVISQPIRKAARWMGIRIDEKRGDHEYVELMRALRKLRDSLGLDRVADLDQGLYALYYRCLVGEGRKCTNFEALARTKRKSALSRLGDAARQAVNLRTLFDDARDRLEELEGPDRDEFLQRLLDAVTEFGSEVIDELENQRSQYFQRRARDIQRKRERLVAQFPALARISRDAVELLAGAALLWDDQQQDANPLPGLIAVSCGQAFEHELREVVFRRLALPAAATANAYSWLAENDPLLANHGEAADTWRAAVSTARQGPKFEVLVRMVATCADPTLGASRLVGRLGEALVASFPGLAGAAAPEDYGPALFAADLDRLREMRNRCVHRAGDGRKLAEQASQLVFAPDTGILASLGRSRG
ncbi:MAG: hypothetical protein KF754_12340 [Planctomycetes bacterium]|nr:hypothetical protein [Planctomycetota bacterium]